MNTLYYWLGLIVFWWWALRLLERVVVLPLLNLLMAPRAPQPVAAKPKPAPQPGLFFELLRGKR